jgi:Tol biopolymer transport system component
LTDGESFELDSTVSPDSRWVYYDTNFNTGEGGKTELRKISIDGGEPIVLREFSPGNLIPQISPDGRLIVGLTYPGFTIFSASDGMPFESLETDKKADLFAGAKWTPDGKSLTYLVNRQGTPNIWQQSLNGSAARPLTDFPKGHIYSYAFSNDGTRLFLARGYLAFDAILIRNFH